MPLLHYQQGCIDCGEYRSIEDMIAKEWDIYFQDQSGTRVRVGFCRMCFQKGTFDYGKIQRNLAESEKQCCVEKGMDTRLAEPFQRMKFVTHTPWKEFWKDAR